MSAINAAVLLPFSLKRTIVLERQPTVAFNANISLLNVEWWKHFYNCTLSEDGATLFSDQKLIPVNIGISSLAFSLMN